MKIGWVDGFNQLNREEPIFFQEISRFLGEAFSRAKDIGRFIEFADGQSLRVRRWPEFASSPMARLWMSSMIG